MLNLSPSQQAIENLYNKSITDLKLLSRAVNILELIQHNGHEDERPTYINKEIENILKAVKNGY